MVFVVVLFINTLLIPTCYGSKLEHFNSNSRLLINVLVKSNLNVLVQSNLIKYHAFSLEFMSEPFLVYVCQISCIFIESNLTEYHAFTLMFMLEHFLV